MDSLNERLKSVLGGAGLFSLTAEDGKFVFYRACPKTGCEVVVCFADTLGDLLDQAEGKVSHD